MVLPKINNKMLKDIAMKIITQTLHTFISTTLFFLFLFSSSVPLRAMENNQPLPVGEIPKLLIIDDKFPVYTRDFINEEIKALINSNKFSVSLFAEKTITDPNELAKLPDWMKHISIDQLKKLPDNLNEYAIIFACWGNIGEKIAKHKCEGTYNGILVTRFRGSPEERIGRPHESCYAYLKRYGDLYVPNCDFFRKELCDKFGLDAKKFIVQYEAVDVPTINTMLVNIEPKITLQKKISLISVCRLEPKKGLDIALQAVARLRANNASLKLHYTIIGDGSRREALKKLIKNLKIRDIVTMIGGKNKQEVIKWIATSDILLAPSYTSQDGDIEGIMNVLKEAGVAKTVVVATDHAGAPELIEHNRTGVLAKQNDVDDLTEKLEYAITNSDHWSEWRNNLKREIEERFDGLKVYPQLIEVLMNTLNAQNNTDI